MGSISVKARADVVSGGFSMQVFLFKWLKRGSSALSALFREPGWSICCGCYVLTSESRSKYFLLISQDVPKDNTVYLSPSGTIASRFALTHARQSRQDWRQRDGFRVFHSNDLVWVIRCTRAGLLLDICMQMQRLQMSLEEEGVHAIRCRLPLFACDIWEGMWDSK